MEPSGPNFSPVIGFDGCFYTSNGAELEFQPAPLPNILYAGTLLILPSERDRERSLQMLMGGNDGVFPRKISPALR